MPIDLCTSLRILLLLQSCCRFRIHHPKQIAGRCQKLCDSEILIQVYQRVHDRALGRKFLYISGEEKQKWLNWFQGFSTVNATISFNTAKVSYSFCLPRQFWALANIEMHKSTNAPIKNFILDDKIFDQLNCYNCIVFVYKRKWYATQSIDCLFIPQFCCHSKLF